MDRLGYRDEAYASVRSRFPPRLSCCSPTGGSRAAARLAGVGKDTWPWSRPAARSPRAGPARRRRGRSAATRSRPVRAAREDEQAKRVVLRRLARRLGRRLGGDLARGRPGARRGEAVIVSMGDVAASGGYYIACPADLILALPATVTGSIGVFSGKFVIRSCSSAGADDWDGPAGRPALMYSPGGGSTTGSWPAGGDGRRDLPRLRGQGGAPAGAARPGHRGGRPRPGWTGRDALDAGLVDQLGACARRSQSADAGRLPENARSAARCTALARPARPAPEQRGPAGAARHDLARLWRLASVLAGLDGTGAPDAGDPPAPRALATLQGDRA